MRASRILKRKAVRKKSKLLKQHIKKALRSYREENEHLLNPPSRHDFDKKQHTILLERYNKNLMDYQIHKATLYKKLVEQAKRGNLGI